MRSSSLERTRCSKEAHFWVEPGSQQIYQLGGVLHDFSGLPAASGRWIPGLPTGDGSAALVGITMKAKGPMYCFAAMG